MKAEIILSNFMSHVTTALEVYRPLRQALYRHRQYQYNFQWQTTCNNSLQTLQTTTRKCGN